MEDLIKICTKCFESKNIISFSKRNGAKDGYKNQCRQCINQARINRRICGIYKIISPSGKIYIGQSVCIKTRWSSYKTRGCEKQIILQKSFNKYGWKSHIFEIIEECLEEDLNLRERYWQEFYDATGRNGLNCVLVNDKVSFSDRKQNRVENKNKYLVPWYIEDILDINTGVFYYTVLEASTYSGVPRSHLSDMLKGKGFNKTSLIKGEMYENGFLPNTLFTPKVHKRTKMFKDGFGVVDYLTGDTIGSTKEVAEVNDILETTLRSYLKGFANNPTNFIYEKDFNAGLSPKNLCNSIPQNIKVIDYITGKIYNSYKEVCDDVGTYPRKLKEYLNKPDISPHPLLRLDDYNNSAQKQKIY